MAEVDEKLVKSVMFEILHIERQNIRSKAKTDIKMVIRENVKLSK